METFEGLVDAARSVLDDAIELRRRIHRRPELGLDLPLTQTAILEWLASSDVIVRTGTALTSVVVVLETGRPGPTVLLRADMDALPMTEETGLSFASEVPGAAHACGHDAHVAMLAGAVRVLASVRHQLTGKVVFMFQPGEEGFHGAKVMLDEGLVDDVGPIDMAFALHQFPGMPSGMIATRSGPILASADTFEIRVVGRGGHASMPHNALDPIPAACEIVIALQTMITRRVDVFDPAVVTIGKIASGTTNNVIPEIVHIEGTIRTLSAATRTFVHEQVERVATGIGVAHGLNVIVSIEAGFPVTVNDQSATELVIDVATRLVGPAMVVVPEHPAMGAEDFSYVLEVVPGAMALLGTQPPDVALADVESIHSNKMVLDEQAMVTGIALYAAIAMSVDAAIADDTLP